MVTEITQGVKVTVETEFQPGQSNLINGEYVFAYRITIENVSDNRVQLLRRHWYIFDSLGEYREVEGEGVVGQQPILHPLDVHQYVSACYLTSEMGRMHGSYTFMRMEDGKLFEVVIPEFSLIVPAKLN